MGVAVSRIWSDICAIESDNVRMRMLETVLSVPEYAVAAQQAGVYVTTVTWLTARRQGLATPFPYATSVRDRIEHEGSGLWQKEGRWSGPGAGAGVPAHSVPRIHIAEVTTEMVVSPAAKALDFFQEALGLLGISEADALTHELLRTAYKRASLSAHPDKGGSAAAFDGLRRAYRYVERILDRVKPRTTAEETQRMSAPVTMENARASRAEPVAPVKLSAKKLDMSTFNKLFEENRLPDPTRDSGYGDWLKSQDGSDSVTSDPRLKGKFNQEAFETVFREKAMRHGGEIVKRLEPDAIVSTGGTELGGDTRNFTASFGAGTQFTDLKEAYTSGSTVFQEVADVRVTERSARTIQEAKRIREEAMSRVDPDEGSRIAAAAAALEERERQRQLRAAAADTTAEAWASQMRRRLMVTDR